MLSLIRKQEPEIRQITLDDLWHEAERLGNLRVFTTASGWENDGQRTGYDVRLVGRIRNTVIKVEVKHTELMQALANAIREAKEMGLGR